MKPVKRISTDFHFARHTKCFAKSPINSSLNVIAMRRRWMCVHVTFQNCWHKSHISLFLSHTDTPLMRSTKRGWHCINLHFNRSFYGRLKWRQLNALNDRQFIYCFVFFFFACIKHATDWTFTAINLTKWNPVDRVVIAFNFHRHALKSIWSWSARRVSATEKWSHSVAKSRAKIRVRVAATIQFHMQFIHTRQRHAEPRHSQMEIVQQELATEKRQQDRMNVCSWQSLTN